MGAGSIQTASDVQILETHLEFVLRPCQRALVDHWLRPTPAIMAQFFSGVDTYPPTQSGNEVAEHRQGPLEREFPGKPEFSTSTVIIGNGGQKTTGRDRKSTGCPDWQTARLLGISCRPDLVSSLSVLRRHEKHRGLLRFFPQLGETCRVLNEQRRCDLRMTPLERGSNRYCVTFADQGVSTIEGAIKIVRKESRPLHGPEQGRLLPGSCRGMSEGLLP